MGYKMRIRKQYKQGPNPSEYKLESLLEIQGIYYSRRGYPDYTILDKNGEIFGFIEVKPFSKRKLKVGQERFKRFCAKHNIPFAKWSPGEPYPF